MNSDNRTIAILGSAFNPIHNGHLLFAKCYKEQFKDSSLLFMPSSLSAHKTNDELASNAARIEMIRLALQNEQDLAQISTMEIERGGTSYTLDTVAQIKKIYKGCNVHILIGDDLIETLPTWKKIATLCEEVTFVVALRECTSRDAALKRIKKIKQVKNGKFLFLDNPLLEVSSTVLREKIATGQTISDFTPQLVAKYIEANNIYCFGEEFATLKNAYDFLQKNVKESRLLHCKSVALEASRLAKIYQIPRLESYAAGFFHDIARNVNNETVTKKALCYYKANNLECDPYLLKNPVLLHGEAGATILGEIGIKSKNLLEAVATHTLGKKEMGLLSAIIFLADYLEPTREFYDKKLSLSAKKLPLALLLKKVAKKIIKYDKIEGRKSSEALLYFASLSNIEMTRIFKS